MMQNSNKKRLSWMSLALLATTSEACVQVTLQSIANTNGQITDFQSPEDELYVWMGVSRDVMITWNDTMRKYDTKSFTPGIVTFPCFHDSTLWIEMEEQDTFKSDKAQIAMGCKNLQLGKNKIIMHIEEDNNGINNGADVIGGPYGTSFTFGSGNNDKTAQYTFTFDVVQNCSLRLDQASYTNSASTPGNVNFMSVDIATELKPKMDNEYVAPYVPPPPPPIVVIPEPVPEPVPVPSILVVVEPEPVLEPELPVVVEPETVPVVEPVEPEQPVTVEPETVPVVEPVVEPESTPEPVPELEPVVEDVAQDLDVIEIQPAEEIQPDESTSDETNNGNAIDLNINTFNTDIPEGQEQTEKSFEEDEEVLQVILTTGDKINLQTDIGEDDFESFTSFKSTQFFVTEFERTTGLLTEDVEEPMIEPNWFEDDTGLGVPGWVLILICSLAGLFILLAIYICIQMRRNKSERGLQERAIVRELQLAKSEGVEIPDDLEKRLERFQDMEENGMKKGSQKEGGQMMKQTGSNGEYKVHPAGAATDASSPDRRGQRNFTRYGGSGMNDSQNTNMSNSQSKLIRNQKTDDGFGGYGQKQNGPLSSPFYNDQNTLQKGGNVGIIQQPIDDNDMVINTVRKSIDGFNVVADCQLESIEIREEDRTDINDI